MSSTTDVLALLAQMETTRDLPLTIRELLAAEAHLMRLAAGNQISRHSVADHRLFLVDGHLYCKCQGTEYRFDSCLGLTAPRELFEEPGDPEDTLITETACLLLHIPIAVLDEAHRRALDVNMIELDDVESAFLAELYELIAANRLELPARPEVAIRIQQLTISPSVGIDELVEVIQSDGTLAGAMIHATNTARFRALREILSVRDAVLRLGFDNTRMLATNLALRQVFKATHHVTREAITNVWTESVLCSAFSYLLADHLKVLNRDRALLAGLIAGIGAVPIIHFLEKHDANPTADRVKRLVDKLRSIAGVLVINYWTLGADLVAVAEQVDHWDYCNDTPDYASLTVIARWASANHLGQPCPAAAEIPAFQQFGLQIPQPGKGLEELADSSEAFHSLRNMFEV
ncbi:HDOD domain-containing protein [Thiospirillum jenense]|uniref:HDOD domain-containing protein n=1 Tax=Thiospirillum jenense TaxID=1653858 RepID=A0A839HCK3_9GAMM|nr:HDOD domain-containing protein [Thiospirillum jenense]MBB1126663.1 HDOD domain-containing protein [Thiospirillum jenense]